MVCPDTDSAVQTIPAMAMTKNIPVVPERPKRSSTTDEMMMVSMVMPETGLRAVVAMAFAATEVKKNEKKSVKSSPATSTIAVGRSVPKNTATPIAPMTTPMSCVTTGMSRSVRSSTCASPWRKALRAIPNDPPMTRSDLMMPKMPAVAIAPTPM